MKLWKAWFEIRQKFYLSFVLVTLLMLPTIVAAAVASLWPKASGEGLAEGASAGGPSAAEAIGHELELWMGGSAHIIFAVLAVVLAVGGILSLGNARSNLMTLSLPERRNRWLLTQAAVSALLVLALCLWEGSLLMVTGWLTGFDVPFGRLLVAILLTTLSAIIWIWPAILATALTREAVRAALLVISVMVALLLLNYVVEDPWFVFEAIADVGRWETGVPWEHLLAGAAVAGGSAWLALRRFDRMEF
jgi:hypothetical protein